MRQNLRFPFFKSNMFTFLKGNYEFGRKGCCALNMSLAIFETKAEQTCVTDYTKSMVHMTLCRFLHSFFYTKYRYESSRSILYGSI